MAAGEASPLSFRTYREYLESLVEPRDLQYLESLSVGRQLVELGVRGPGDVLQREEFEARKAELEAAAPQKPLASVGKELKDNFLKVLAEREEGNRTGKISAYPGDNTTRMPVKTHLYLHVVIYDHIIRRGI